MLFWLKKIIGHWLMPLPFCLLVLVTGLVLLLRPRTAKWGKRVLATGVLLLAFFSHSAISTWLLRPLEARYPTVPELTAHASVPPALARCNYIVVLGSGHGDDNRLPSLGRLSPAALARLTEAVRLARALPHAKIITCGPGRPDRPTHAETLVRAAETLGLARERFLKVEVVRDTEDEANRVRAIVGDAPVALVTTAWHMPRAVALFRHAQVDVLPCPTDFIAKRGDFAWTSFVWDSAALERSTAAVRERLGYVWIWLRGKT